MLKSERRISSAQWKAIKELAFGLIGTILISAFLYVLIGVLNRIALLKAYKQSIDDVRSAVALLWLALGAASLVWDFIKQLRNMRTSQRVAEAIGDIKDAKSIAEIT